MAAPETRAPRVARVLSVLYDPYREKLKFFSLRARCWCRIFSSCFYTPEEGAALRLWRRKAMEMVPALQNTISSAADPIAMGIEFFFALKRAYEQNPPDDELIASLYRYAHWCSAESKTAHVATAIHISFYEQLRTYPRAWEDLPNRLTDEHFLVCKEVFQSFLPPGEYEALEDKILATARKRCRRVVRGGERLN